MSRSNLSLRSTVEIYFITTSVHNRLKILTHQTNAEIIADSLTFLVNQGSIRIYGYVIMPDHIHLILKSKVSEQIMRRFKSFTARKVIDNCTAKYQYVRLSKMKTSRGGKQCFQLWEKSYHPVAINREAVFDQKLHYIYENPVKSGLVTRAEEYHWSNALMYEKGLRCDRFCRNAFLNPDDFKPGVVT